MTYDPCGSKHLEGDDILKRLAEYLNVEVEDLKDALLAKALLSRAARLSNEQGDTK